MKLLPEEPTPEMLKWIQKVAYEEVIWIPKRVILDIYREMSKFAPEIPAHSWTKFNLKDEATHPSTEQDVNAVTFRGKVVTLRFNGIDDETGLPMWFWQATDDRTNLTVTHWQPLPEFKE